MRAVVTASPPAEISSAGMLSTPDDSRFFNDCTEVSSSFEGWGGRPLFLPGHSLLPMDLHCLVILQLRAVFCLSIQYVSVFFC